MNNHNAKLDINTLETWLWEAACVIRGPIDAPKFKDYILPLIFLKRLSDVFEDDLQQLGNTTKYVDADHSLVRFYIPASARWSNVARQTTDLGEYLTDAVRAVARENPKLNGVIDVRDFNETAAGARIFSDDRLRALIQRLSQYRLGLKDVEPDILGRAYEYLLRKFAEGQGQSAGEFYTPREVAILMARILDPDPGDEIYDPACGSGGLLVKSFLRFREKYGEAPNVAPLRFYGQEINPTTFAMARMNAFIYDMEAEIAIGDTMNRPAFTNSDGSLRCFNKVTANPMWNQNFAITTYEHDTYGRFNAGIPPASSADWGWVQHMFASLGDRGKMAMVIDTGAVSRGSGSQGSNRERDIRRVFVEKDLIEAILLLPDNLFYNTTAASIILVINKAKRHPGEMLIINCSKEFLKGRPKNYLSEENIKRISAVYLGWQQTEGLSKVIKLDEIVRNDYDLSPSRYVSGNHEGKVLPLDETGVLFSEAEEEQQMVDRELEEVMNKLGLLGLKTSPNNTSEDVKMTEVGLLPSHWQVVKLIQLAAKSSDIVGGPFGSNLKVSDYRDSGIPIIRLQNIERNLFVNKEIKFISKEKAEELKYHSFVAGDIILAKLGDPIGKTCIVPETLREGIVVADVVRIRVVPSLADKDYVVYALNTRMVEEQFRSQKKGTTRPRVNVSEVRNILLPLPPLNEQKEIARLLSIIKKAIETTANREAALQEVFKSMLLNLITGQVRSNKTEG